MGNSGNIIRNQLYYIDIKLIFSTLRVLLIEFFKLYVVVNASLTMGRTRVINQIRQNENV